MDIHATPSSLISAGVVLLVLWRLYSRVRRMVGRQRYRSVRPWVTVVLFPLLLLALLLASLAQPESLAALVLGAVVGAALGVWGLRLTRFEATEAGLFYTPNAQLGIALSLLFIGRIVYRFLQLRLLGGSPALPPEDFTRSPLTLAIFATLAGYYIVYAVGLLRWAASQRASAAPPEAGRGA